MSKLEEVKKILDQHYGESPDGMGNPYIAKSICQLFTPKPDESGLLSDEQILQATQLGWDKDVKFEDFGYLSGRRQVAKAQRDLTRAECQARVERIARDMYEMLLIEQVINLKTPIVQYVISLMQKGIE